MDPFAAACAAAAAALSRLRFFIGGAPKSGTTWLQQALDAHPQIRCAGEGHFVNWLASPLRETLLGYNNKIAFGDRFIYDGAGDYKGITEGDFRHLARMAAGLALARLPCGDKPILGDKTPYNILHLDGLDALFPGRKIIDMRRDGRDVAAALMHQKLRLNDDPDCRPGTEAWRRHLRQACDVWRRSIAAADHWRAQRPEHIVTIRYEALTASPRETLAQAVAFLGADADPAVLDACLAAADFEARSGRARGVADPSAFRRKGVVGDWRETFDAADCAILDEELGAL